MSPSLNASLRAWACCTSEMDSQKPLRSCVNEYSPTSSGKASLLMRKANGSNSFSRMCMAFTSLILPSNWLLVICRMVSALLFSSVPICPLVLSSPLFRCNTVWIWRSCILDQRMRSFIKSTDSLGLLMSYRRSRMPSMTTKPIPGSEASAWLIICRRCLGLYSRSMKNSRLSVSRSVGSPASLRMRSSTLWQWHLLCSVST